MLITNVSGSAAEPARPVGRAEFAALMAPFRPFERGPILAVAVSGGADSMALVHLAHDWARSLGGHVIALTVDHGLRPESAKEVRQVAEWLMPLGVETIVLRWQPPDPLRNIQAAARDARYKLMFGWCLKHGVLHLMTAHHADDQAETLLLRLGRGSGVAGLAAMAALDEHPEARLLRPLLTIPANRLRATLRARGQDWIEDPSNRNLRFSRVRVRASDHTLSALGLTRDRVVVTSLHLGRAREALERQTEQLIARSAAIHPAGFVRLDREAWGSPLSEIALRCLAAILIAVSGAEFAPRFERLQALCQWLKTATNGARTLSGCRIVVTGGSWLVCRELRAAAPQLPLTPGFRGTWDSRFLVEVGARTELPSDLAIGVVGRSGGGEVGAIAEAATTHHVPALARPTLPGIWRRDKLEFVPALGGERTGWRAAITVRYRPTRLLSGAGFVGA